MHHLPFVLSKKTSPLMDYLLVHHVTFPIMVWVIINYYPGGHATFPGFINAATHVMLFGMKFVVMAFPKVKQWNKQIHFYLHVSKLNEKLFVVKKNEKKILPIKKIKMIKNRCEL
jgi:hypothetical protein